MDDVFVERLVARKSSGTDTLIKIGILAGAVILIFASFSIPAISFLAPFLVVGIGWGAWYLLSKTNVEFEYSLSNGDLTIDAIYGQRKRKTLSSINVRDRMEIMAAVNNNNYTTELNKKAGTTIDAASMKNAPNRWFMNVKGESGLVRIFFEPDEKLVTAMRRCAPSVVKLS